MNAGPDFPVGNVEAAAQVGERDQRILIVDDQEANVRLLERLLRKSGYAEVVATTDPTEVASLYENLKPDLILLDLRMPGLDGFGVMQQLSKLVAADDYLPILVLTADVTQESKQRALTSGARDFLTKPLDPAEVAARVGNLLEMRGLHLQLRRHNEFLEEMVHERTEELRGAIDKLELAEKDLRLAQEETIHRLSLAAEFRDDETSRHIERMSRYSALLARRSGEDERRSELLRIASKMHDIGKIGVPDAILLKLGKLTQEQFEIMKQHSSIGYQILRESESELASTGAVIAWTHHEKVDASGYPRGLKGDEIPLEGRIAAVADVFDALATDRVYRKAFTLPEALSIMREGRARHFDADLLDCFLESIDDVLAAKGEFDDRSPQARPS